MMAKAKVLLPEPFGSHEGVDFAAADPQTHPLENRFSRHLDVKLANRQRFTHGLTF